MYSIFVYVSYLLYQAAVDILRNGIKIKLYMEAHYGTKYTHYFRLRDVRVRVDKMKLYVQGSRYGWLIKLFKYAFRRTIFTEMTSV